jgi:uncharacterized phage protein (TIGR01671 family)
MNRIILFKAKDFNNKWQIGTYYYGCMYPTSFSGHYVNDILIDEKTLCQFTGLKDINDNKIFEGDVLANANRKDWDKTNFVSYEVFYHDNDSCEFNVGFQMNRHHFHGAVCGTGDFKKFTPSSVVKMEIISNIYDSVDVS